MTVNYAKSFNKNAVDAFALASLTRGALSTDYDFIADSGKTVQLFTNSTATMNDYSRTGANRYGTPEDLGNTVQEVACTRERSFAFVIDRLNQIDTGLTQEAGAALRRQIDEVITPEIDTWTLSKLVSEAKAGNTITEAATAANAYDLFLQLGEKLDNENTPVVNRVAWVAPDFYRFLKLDDTFIKAGDMAQDMLIKGQVGEVDGVKIVKAPANYLPTATKVVMAHKDAAIQPVRLEEYKTHDNPQGYSGVLCEGLVYYDAFVLDAREGSVAVLKAE